MRNIFFSSCGWIDKGVLGDVEIKLILFRVSPGPKDTDIGGIFVAFVFDECFLEFVVEFEIASG